MLINLKTSTSSPLLFRDTFIFGNYKKIKEGKETTVKFKEWSTHGVWGHSGA